MSNIVNLADTCAPMTIMPIPEERNRENCHRLNVRALRSGRIVGGMSATKAILMTGFATNTNTVEVTCSAGFFDMTVTFINGKEHSYSCDKVFLDRYLPKKIVMESSCDGRQYTLDKAGIREIILTAPSKWHTPAL